MKNSIFTIVLLLGTSFAFAQEAQSTVSKHAINTKGTAATNGKVIETKVNNVPIESVEVVKTKTKSNQSNDKLSSSQTAQNQPATISSEAVLTSEKKHTKSGHVTLLK